ncbi:MAG: DUF444 family protein [Nanoarchaeota archaeon]|nr:DUF444 family protein [Nanoarchaeota archaeon]
MVSNIEQDKRRFHDIIKGNVRKGLKDLIIKGAGLPGRGKDGKVFIPIPRIDIPKFRNKEGDNEDKLGKGEGDIGDEVGEGEEEEGQQKAGDKPGEHMIEMNVIELADIMGEELGLPRIEPKGKRTIYQEFDKYSGERKKGPSALLRKRKTLKQALKRAIGSGDYDPKKPRIPIESADMRYRSWTMKPVPESSAVIFYLMDVSGSMEEEQKELARKISFWSDLWLRKHYPGLESVYVIHDAQAKEVTQDQFYHTRESGGTIILSGYQEVSRIIQSRYPVDDWNIYMFQYSDGDDWTSGWRREESGSIEFLIEDLLPKLNLFCYAQTTSPYGDGKHLEYIQQLADGDFALAEKIRSHQIDSNEDVLPAITKFLSTGK